jgi:uncharacterized protein YdhG (YjbR/CyaY superfamily)
MDDVMAMKKKSPVDKYLAGIPDAERLALERIRKIVLKSYPGAQESTYYGLPAFTLNGKAFVAFRAAKTHCALHPLSGTVVEALGTKLAAFETSKGTVRFTPDAPLPETLVKAILKRRAAELGA